MKEAVFVSAVRTPIGRYMGSLKTVRVQDLAAHTMKAAINRAGIDSGALDMSIYSQSMQSSFPANVGRHAWTLSGFSEDPAGFTLNTLCAGALQTIISGFNKIIGEEYRGMLVGGVESYSLAQYYIFHPRYEFGPHSLCFNDSKMDIEKNAQPEEEYGELTAAVLADIIATRYGFSRMDLDSYALQDREKALAATRGKGRIGAQIEPVIIKQRKKEIIVNADELPEAVTLEELMAIQPDDEGGTATDENVAPWADGAASLIMLSAERAKELGAKPLAKMIGFGIAAGNPTFLERTTARSIDKALAMCGLKPKDLGFLDIHTPSAAYGLAVEGILGEASGKVNVDGSSLSFGHPGAATGGIMATAMIHRLAGKKGRRGLINVGALGGQSLSIVIEGC